MVPPQKHIGIRGCDNMPSGFLDYLSIYKHIITNNAQELMSYRFELNYIAIQIRIHFVYTKFLTGIFRTNERHTLANSAMQLAHVVKKFGEW
jgi:hypothetical protein